jgi:periplasmic divalent cation tolerance protein
MSEAIDPALVWCPFPDDVSAADTAEILLEIGLITCANIMPGMRSIYIWNGERGDEREVGVLFKTNAAVLAAMIEKLAELHPYDEPAILGWRCDTAAPATAAWLGALAR